MTSNLPRRPVSAYLMAAGSGEAIGRVAQILGMALAGRILGPSGLGTIALAWSLTSVAQGLVQGGPELVGIRLLTQVESDRTGQAQIIAAVTRLKLVLAAASLPLLFAFDFLLGHSGGPDRAQLALQILSMALISLNHGWAFRGLHRPFDQSWLRGGQAVLGLLFLGPMLVFWPSPQSAPAAECLAALAMLIAGRYRLAGVLPLAVAGSGAKHSILKPALTLGFAGVVANIQWMSPIFIAASLLGPAPLGILAAVFRLIQGLNGIFQIGLQAVFPLLSSLFAHRARQAGDAVIALSLQCGILVLIGIIFLTVGADPLMTLLLGQGFPGAAGLFQMLLPALLPIALSSPFGYALMARGDNTAYMSIATLSALAMALCCRLSFALMPGTDGAQAVHLVLWGQLAGTLFVVWRSGLATKPGVGWRTLLDPRKLGQLLRDEMP